METDYQKLQSASSDQFGFKNRMQGKFQLSTHL